VHNQVKVDLLKDRQAVEIFMDSNQHMVGNKVMVSKWVNLTRARDSKVISNNNTILNKVMEVVMVGIHTNSSSNIALMVRIQMLS